jgi:hypothetical protein
VSIPSYEKNISAYKLQAVYTGFTSQFIQVYIVSLHSLSVSVLEIMGTLSKNSYRSPSRFS